RMFCPLKIGTAMICSDFAYCGCLLLYPFRTPVKLEKQERRLGQLELAIGVRGLDRVSIHELDACNGYPHLDNFDDAIDRVFQSREIARSHRNSFRLRMKSHSDLGNDAKRTFATNEQSGQIVTGRGL